MLYACKKNCNMHLSRFILNLCNKSYRMNAYKLKYLINLHGNIARLTVFFWGGGQIRKEWTRLFSWTKTGLTWYTKLGIQWFIVCTCTYQINYMYYAQLRWIWKQMTNPSSFHCVQCLEAVIRVLFHIIVYLQFARWPQLATVWSPETR